MRSDVVVKFLLTLTAAAFVAAPALAVPRDPAGTTRLEQAREESSVTDRPRTRFELPAAVLRLSASELLASSGQKLELSVTLQRKVGDGSLALTLPDRWTARSGISDLPFARVPAAGRGSTSRAVARRSGSVVTFAFHGASSGAVASFELTDVGIPAGTYELPYRWRERGGPSSRGRATVIFYAPTREAQAPERQFAALDVPGKLANPGIEKNATLDTLTESETYLTVVPGNRKRFVVGANGGGGFSAWVTNDGGQNFTKAPLPAITDAPGEAGPETSSLCCDPMSTADSLGNMWYGGLSFSNGAGNPSRIIVNRLAPGATAFQQQTVGLRQRTTGTQDKPMMAIDNSSSSPRFGRLYVVWDEPSAGGINVVITQCDTRPGGVANAANCDNADNWTVPVSVTPAPGSYTYADVAASPDGTVNVVWWDHSATNAIRGDTCGPAANCAAAASWGTPQTTATLDSTGGVPVPFACPILAQPGGRPGPATQIDVDRSGGAQHGRVYVTWGDLRPGSGTTKCQDTLPPAITHLTWDSFVASAVGGLPGGASPSASVGSRLLTDGEGGGQPNSDEWFPGFAVDQSSGQAWAGFYSTRDVANRRTTHFYVRPVTASGGSHTIGALTRVSSLPSDYSNNPCCGFGNDYGDYSGIDATQGIALPVWSDKRDATDGEAYTFVTLEPALTAGTKTLSEAGGDGDGALEPGEPFTLVQRLSNNGSTAATGVGATLAESEADLSLTQATSAYPDIAVGASQPNTTAYAGTVSSAAACGDSLDTTLQVTTDQGPFALPVTLPTGAPGPVAQFTATPGAAIPDNNPAGVSSNLVLSGVSGLLNDLDVRLNITHTFDGHLQVKLRSPDGTTISLVHNRGGSGDNFTNTDLDDEAAIAISAGTAPFTGSFRPEQPLTTFDGKNANGTWTLTVADVTGTNVGTLSSWRLSARGSVCSTAGVAPPTLTDTDPDSPSPDTTPFVKGTAPAGSTVSLYTNATCTGTAAATGSAAAFASPGLEVTVPANQTTQIRGTATVGAVTSACSAPLSYTSRRSSFPAVVRSTTWLLKDTLAGGAPTTTFLYGTRPLVALMGDWDGNGSETAGSFEGGTFKLRNSNSAGAADITFAFGDPAGHPVAGDFSGDGIDDVAVYRNGLWQVRRSDGTVLASFNYGSGSAPATTPVSGDWDGDGTDGVGTYTRSTATWNMRTTATPAGVPVGPAFNFGTPNSSSPVTGDWDGDAIDTVATKTGVAWSVRNTNSAGAGDVTFSFGLATDAPLSWQQP